MNINTAAKAAGGLLLIGGLIGLVSTNQNMLAHIAMFAVGFVILLTAGVFDNATKLDNWTKTWGKHGNKQ